MRGATNGASLEEPADEWLSAPDTVGVVRELAREECEWMETSEVDDDSCGFVWGAASSDEPGADCAASAAALSWMTCGSGERGGSSAGAGDPPAAAVG